ncbi:MAG: polysaccharide pyruvyl transferase family protein [Slackia sp.]|nr:polysaccharide pyruvyl transferase family protein [Slackia sp.]
MFARVLIIAACKPDETDWHARLAYACAAQGHAVRLWRPPDELAEAAFSAVCKAFHPTVALWTAEAWSRWRDEIGAAVAASCASGVIALRPTEAAHADGDFILAVGTRCKQAVERAIAETAPAPSVIGMPASVDSDYLRAKISDPEAKRDSLSFDQECTPEREALMDAAKRAAGGLRSLAFHPSWQDCFDVAQPGENRAFFRRTTRFAIVDAEQNDTPSEAHIAMRIAEGAVVLYRQEEASLEADDPSEHDARALFAEAFYRDADDLDRLIERLANDDDETEKLRTRQRDALMTLPPLERAIDDALTAIDDALDARSEDARMQRPRVLSRENRSTKVVMYGWFGARNFGDDLLLTSTVSRIEKRYPDASFHVIGANTGVIENEYGYQATTPDRKYEVRAFLEQASAMVLCGGLLFDDPLGRTAGEMEFCLDPWIEPTGQAAVCLLARSLGVPSVYLGFGAGPIDNRPTRIAVNLIARSGARFLPRDEHTRELLMACDVPESQIDVRADLVLGARAYVEGKAVAGGPAQQTDGFFVVSLRRWHRNPVDFAQRIARAIDTIAQETGLAAVMLPFDQDDVELHREVVAHMKHPAVARLIEQRPAEAELLRIVTQSKFAFAMRLHCSILHHILDKPAVGLNYNDKIEAHFRRFDQADMLLELDAGHDAMVRALRAAATWDEADKQALQQRRRDAAALVDSAFEELFATIDAPRRRPTGELVYFPRSASHIECTLRKDIARAWRHAEEADAKRAALEEENAALRAEIAAVRASKSYRFGNAFMRIPHAAVSRLGARKSR